MNIVFVNGTEDQQRIVQEGFDQLGTFIDRLNVTVNVSFTNNPTTTLHNEFAYTTWSSAAGPFNMEFANDFLSRGGVFATEAFFRESVTHEVGHIVQAQFDDAAVARVAAMFGGTPAQWHPDDTPWEQLVQEGFAETFKDVFLGDLRVYDNRTNWRLPRDQFDAFMHEIEAATGGLQLAVKSFYPFVQPDDPGNYTVPDDLYLGESDGTPYVYGSAHIYRGFDLAAPPAIEPATSVAQPQNATIDLPWSGGYFTNGPVWIDANRVAYASVRKSLPSPDGIVPAGARGFPTWVVVDVTTGEELQVFDNQWMQCQDGTYAQELQFTASSNGQQLYVSCYYRDTGGRVAYVRIYDLATGESEITDTITRPDTLGTSNGGLYFGWGGGLLADGRTVVFGYDDANDPDDPNKLEWRPYFIDGTSLVEISVPYDALNLVREVFQYDTPVWGNCIVATVVNDDPNDLYAKTYVFIDVDSKQVVKTTRLPIGGGGSWPLVNPAGNLVVTGAGSYGSGSTQGDLGPLVATDHWNYYPVRMKDGAQIGENSFSWGAWLAGAPLDARPWPYAEPYLSVQSGPAGVVRYSRA
jgi:hypothetical protein